MKESYEVKGYLVEGLIEEMIDLLKKRNELRLEYLETDISNVLQRKSLNNKCVEILSEAYAIKKSLELLFNFKVFVNYGDALAIYSDSDRVTSIKVDGVTYEVE